VADEQDARAVVGAHRRSVDRRTPRACARRSCTLPR
jgi:hypothetical protein